MIAARGKWATSNSPVDGREKSRMRLNIEWSMRYSCDASGVRHSRAGVFVGEYGHFDARASSLRQDRFDAIQAIVGLARSKRHLRTRIWETFLGGPGPKQAALAQNRQNWVTWAEY